MNLRRTLALAFILIVGLSFWAYHARPFNQSLPSGVIFTPDIHNLNFTRAPHPNEDPDDLETYRSTKSGIIKIMIFDNLIESQALALIKNKKVQLRLQFMPQPVAYAGFLTNKLKCTHRPTVDGTIASSPKQISIRFQLLANSRLIYGVCSDEEGVYKSQYLLIYCRSTKKLYEIKYFYPKTMPDLTGDLAKCS